MWKNNLSVLKQIVGISKKYELSIKTKKQVIDNILRTNPIIKIKAWLFWLEKIKDEIREKLWKELSKMESLEKEQNKQRTVNIILKLKKFYNRNRKLYFLDFDDFIKFVYDNVEKFEYIVNNSEHLKSDIITIYDKIFIRNRQDNLQKIFDDFYNQWINFIPFYLSTIYLINIKFQKA